MPGWASPCTSSTAPTSCSGTTTRRPTRTRTGAPPGVVGRASSCSSRGPPTWAWPPTTSSSRSATTCGPATRTARAWTRSCWPSSRSVEDALRAAGFTVWPMVEDEADDALAAAAAVAAEDPSGSIGSSSAPRTRTSASASAARSGSGTAARTSGSTPPGVHERLGVPPESVPDLLALVGDSADGFPGLPGWGAKSAAAVLDRWGHLEDIPADPLDVGRRRAGRGQAEPHPARAVRGGAAVPPHRHRRDRRRRRGGRRLGWTGPTEGFPEVAAGARRRPPGRAGHPPGWAPGLSRAVPASTLGRMALDDELINRVTWKIPNALALVGSRGRRRAQRHDHELDHAAGDGAGAHRHRRRQQGRDPSPHRGRRLLHRQPLGRGGHPGVREVLQARDRRGRDPQRPAGARRADRRADLRRGHRLDGLRGAPHARPRHPTPSSSGEVVDADIATTTRPGRPRWPTPA